MMLAEEHKNHPLSIEFRELAAKAKELRIAMENATTYPKRIMAKKKLDDNNKKALEILVKLMKLESTEAGGAKDEALSNEGRTETPIGISASME